MAECERGIGYKRRGGNMVRRCLWEALQLCATCCTRRLPRWSVSAVCGCSLLRARQAAPVRLPRRVAAPQQLAAPPDPAGGRCMRWSLA